MLINIFPVLSIKLSLDLWTFYIYYVSICFSDVAGGFSSYFVQCVTILKRFFVSLCFMKGLS